jgi:hypothetical protein
LEVLRARDELVANVEFRLEALENASLKLLARLEALENRRPAKQPKLAIVGKGGDRHVALCDTHRRHNATGEPLAKPVRGSRGVGQPAPWPVPRKAAVAADMPARRVIALAKIAEA